jgi:16S rRNA (guanine527-N7)-methyltransferase
MEILRKYFPDLTPLQLERYAQRAPLYMWWNERINVISRKDTGNLYLHHVLHSMSIGKIFTPLPGSTFIDAGTGGGFPGIPLAILFPEVHFTLVDSIAKKIRVVDAIIGALKLDNCETRNLRLEQLHDKADFVTCRAVAEIPVLLGWVHKNIRPGGSNTLKNGLLALKGGDLEAEIKSLGTRAHIYNLHEYIQDDFFATKKLVYVTL